MAPAILYTLILLNLFINYSFESSILGRDTLKRMKRSTDDMPPQLLEPFKEAARKEIQESYHSYDQNPMSRLSMSCKNKAYRKILSDFPFVEIRWEYNGDNLSLQPSRMSARLTTLTIQNLLPEDSGVYHCVLKLSPSKVSITVAVFSVVVGNETKAINKGESLVIDCHGNELGVLFKQSRRVWKDPKGWNHFEKSAADKSKDIIKSVNEKNTGVWTCQVEDRSTGKIWKTARVKIITKPELKGIRKLMHYTKNHKTETIIAMFAGTFMLVLIMNCLTKIVDMRQKKIKAELDELRKILGINKENLEGDGIPLLLEEADKQTTETNKSGSSSSGDEESDDS